MNALIAVVVLLSQAPSQEKPMPEAAVERDWNIRGQLTFWWPDVNARFNALEHASDPSSDSSWVSVDKDLDVFDQEAFGIYELSFVRHETRNGRTDWYDFVTLSFWGNKWSGKTTLESREIFDGVTFNQGDRIKSDFQIWNLGLDLSLGGIEPGPELQSVLVTPSVGLRVVDVSAFISGPSGRAEEDVRLLYLGGSFRAQWNRGLFFASFSAGLYFSFSPYRGLGWGDREEWGAILTENALSVGFETGIVRTELGLRLDANYLRNTRDGEDTSEVNMFEWLVGGPFAQVAVRF